MLIDDFGLNVSLFEDLLQKIVANMTSGIVSEKLPPSELWKRSEADVASLRGMAEHLKESMFVLKPERVPSIEKRAEALLQPLSSFRAILFQKSDDPAANSKLALEELRRAVTECSLFLDLARDVKKNPSESISAVLTLKEVYDTKEYLSAIPVPEAAYVRLASLRKNIESLKMAVSNLERTLRDLNSNLDSVVEEISKYRLLRAEKSDD